MRIVIVEDNVRLASTLADGLAEEGHAVEILVTANAAIDRGRRGDLDVMVLDLGLPDRDGLDVLRELRVCQPAPPVLVLTARDGADARAAAFALGALGYLVKPFSFADLLAGLAAVTARPA